ncbi:MAG TPA: CHRD domain-containing protein [Beijerinckia sp.]|nr:CHRD domain-containing protein [Beijerinckia sp.]
MLALKASPLFLVAALASPFALSQLASAEMIHFKAALDGGQEVPPVNTKGTGSLMATFDTATKKLDWTVDYSGLTGPATGAHFHGPAGMGKNADVLVPASGGKNPISGSATLTNAQAKDLLDGKLYFNIHTSANKAGEIRGQLEKGM